MNYSKVSVFKAHSTPFFPKLKMLTLHTNGHRFFAVKSWEFGGTSTKYSAVDDFLNSPHVFGKQCMDIVQEKIDLGHTWEVRNVMKTTGYWSFYWAVFEQLNVISASVFLSSRFLRFALFKSLAIWLVKL